MTSRSKVGEQTRKPVRCSPELCRSFLDYSLAFVRSLPNRFVQTLAPIGLRLLCLSEGSRWQLPRFCRQTSCFDRVRSWDTSFDWVLIDGILTVIVARLIASPNKYTLEAT